MGQTIVLTGMVLAAIPIGDYDKRITILTRERGKISAFARGARRQGSQLTAAANPFAFGEFEVYEGRSSYTVVKASISNYFRQLVEDFENVYYGFYFLEIADYYTRENSDEIHMLKLLYQSMRALEHEQLPNRLVRCIYELKAMVVNGEYPNVFSCQSCGREEELIWFDSSRGGVLCQGCKSSGAIPVDASTRYTLQYIITSGIEKLYTFTVSGEVLSRLEWIMRDYMGRYIDRSFQSLQVLEENLDFLAR
ncbi:MAG: DNA repair protein RecO [Lachnospiraceae bacterium]|nr:DNA repair protein RecO [Lachnospiraceae bacterium]